MTHFRPAAFLAIGLVEILAVKNLALGSDYFDVNRWLAILPFDINKSEVSFYN
jgi:hypothetical protein